MRGLHKLYRLGMLLVIPLILAGCGEPSQAQIMVDNFNVVDPYDYDKIKVIVEEEKSPEEVAKDIIQEELGLNTEMQLYYDEYGLSPQNGLFVNSGILDGPEIPSNPAFDINMYLGQQGQDSTVEDFLFVKYDELQNRRQSVMAQYSTEQQLLDITTDIQQRMTEQEQNIYQQQIAQQQQEELYPELFPKIEITE